LALSLARFVHTAPHAVNGGVQKVWHAPATQDCPVAQRRLHAPQLVTSFCRATQRPLQLVNGAGHAVIMQLPN
jgi:uncharacterized protein (UPF0305 family)